MERFPFVVRRGDERSLGDVDARRVRELLREHGALLLSGFDCDADEFVAFTEKFAPTFSSYRGGAFQWAPFHREAIGGRPTLLTTTGASQGFPIPLHGEMYYLKRRPALLWFYCQEPPVRGGQTTVCDGLAIFSALSDETLRFLETHRIRYIRRFPAGEWREVFQTSDLDALRRICAAEDTEVKVDAATGAVTTEYVCSPLLRRSNDTVFINNLVEIVFFERAFESGFVSRYLPGTHTTEAPFMVRLEDGARVPSAIVREISRVNVALTVDVSWRRGDLLMLDNSRALHGRREAVGSNRVIYVRMDEPS
jgi:alpha-ketoglutarate-dependent taurine dioxygenase